ncbi:MAG TPA: mobile mystery protein A [Gammaproteobacteria bacterium]|nr:mobile mystery protein A [Gammaproteobacteria bacterium]
MNNSFKNQMLAVRQLDKRLKKWQILRDEDGKLRAGWIKILRTTLHMTAQQLANRLGVTRIRVYQLENAEMEDAITLRTLKEAANALECELVYAIVPKGSATLETMIETRAKQLAKEQMDRVAHSMSLEAQSLDADFQRWMLDNLKNPELLDFFKNELRQSKSLQKLIEKLKKKK